MSALDLLLVLLLGPVGICLIVACIGFFATVPHRLGHKEKMFALNEQAKLNAIDVAERQMQVLETATVAQGRSVNPLTYRNGGRGSVQGD